VLGLNPGHYSPGLQSRTGTFATEIREFGPYSAWIRTHPYDRDPWLALHGPNRYYRARLEFVRRWLGDPAAGHHDMLIFELYPWHSTPITGPMRPPPDVITKFVWEPIGELTMRHVFAFGAAWAHLAAGPLRLRQVATLGRGGRDYGSRVPSRTVGLFELPSGQLLVAESHVGGAGPPSRDELERLREALAPFG
jgi:hypothetical protein